MSTTCMVCGGPSLTDVCAACEAPVGPELPDLPDDRASGDFGAWLDRLARARSEDQLFATLAQQRPPTSPLARQQIRGLVIKALGEKLKELESKAAAARTADAWLAEGTEIEDNLQGKRFEAEEIEPWGRAVEGASVLDEVVELFRAYVHAPREALDVLALWATYSHLFDCFGVAPLLDISSPTKRCGKSSAVVLLRHLCRAPLLASNVTPAALFRAVEAWKPTLLIDEADSFARMNDELRGIINSGHTRDTAFVVRAEGDANEPRLFSTWAPKVVAAIGRLPDTIEDRSVRIDLKRKPTNIETRDAFDTEAVRSDCSQPRRRLARFALDRVDEIATAVVPRPAGLNDRAWNNWRPLLAIAAAAGGDWPARAAQAAFAITKAEDESGEDVSVLALQHVWEVLEPNGRLPTATILDYLVAKEEGPWARWWESSVAKGELKSPSARLAKLLRPFGVKPRQLWLDERKTRGYDVQDFETHTLLPYLEKDGRTVQDGRREQPSRAGSTVSHRPTEFSEARNGRIPLPGDDAFPDLIDAAFHNGHVTEGEWLQRRKLHAFIVEAGAA